MFINLFPRTQFRKRPRKPRSHEGGNPMKRSVVCMLSILALALAVPAMAQSEQTASGTVVSSSSTQLVIKTTDGRQLTFVVDSDSKAPANLQQGAPVTVRYHDMNGTFHAANVSATAAAPSASQTTPSTDTTAPGTSATTGTVRRDTTSTPAATTPSTSTTGSDARVDAQDARPTTAPDTTATTAQDTDTGSRQLPATASPLPLLGLSGLLALGGGLGARLLRRRQ
jgi:hypothetical protein